MHAITFTSYIPIPLLLSLDFSTGLTEYIMKSNYHIEIRCVKLIKQKYLNLKKFPARLYDESLPSSISI